MSFDLYCNGKSSFHSHLMEMSEHFNLLDFNTDLLDTAIIKNFIYYIDTNEIPGFFRLLKNHIFIASSEDTFIFHL